MIRRNVLLNVAGGSSAGLLALALIPLQVRVLGVESYGVLALLASIQVLLSIFDLGFSPAITWYVARHSEDAQVSRSALAAALPPYAIAGLVLGALIGVGAPFIAAQLLHLRDLSSDIAVLAMRLGGLAVALRWPVSLLSGFLAGAGRFDLLNAAKTAHAAISFSGMVLVLVAFGTLPAVAAWMAVAALVEFGLFATFVIRVSGGVARPTSSARWLRELWRYGRGVAVIGALSLVLTQSDRVFLARLVSAAQLGEYATAYNLVFGLTLIQLFVSSALYPSFSADFAATNHARIRSRYRDATQAVLFLYGIPLGIFVIFGESTLGIVLTPDAASRTAVVLACLAIGFMLNAAAALPYSLTLSGGLLRPPIAVNALNVVWYLPLLWIAIGLYGPAGGAAAWSVLNASYLVTLIPIIHRRLLHESPLVWVRTAVLPFPLLGLAVFGLLRGLVGSLSAQDPRFWLTILAGSIVYAALASRFLSPTLRGHVQLLIRHPFSWGSASRDR